MTILVILAGGLLMGKVCRERVLVTGGAGFIGSHVVERFLELGRQVIVVDDLSTGDLANVPAGVNFFQVDIRDDLVHEMIGDVRPGIVVHCAAQISVTASMSNPIRDMQVNLLGTAQIINACRQSGVERFVFLSSGGAIYGETVEPANETTPPRPANYYGVHKLAAEQHVALSGLSFAILRPSNVYGPRQRHDQEGGVVSILARQAIGGGPFTITGDGEQSRDFVHVHDVANAILAARYCNTSGIWNVSSGTSTTINDLAAHFERLVGISMLRDHLSPREGDVRTSCLDCSRILTDLGWAPCVSLDDGLSGVLADVEQRDLTRLAQAI